MLFTEGFVVKLLGVPNLLFCRSYESLLPELRGGKGRKRSCFPLVGPTVGENHPNFRPVPTFERAAAYLSAIPETDR